MTFICFFDFAVSGRLHSARYLRSAVCLKLHCAVCASDGRQLEMLPERITYSSATSLSYRARQEPHASPGAFLTLRHALPRLTARLSSVRPGFTWPDLAWLLFLPSRFPIFSRRLPFLASSRAALVLSTLRNRGPASAFRRRSLLTYALCVSLWRGDEHHVAAEHT